MEIRRHEPKVQEFKKTEMTNLPKTDEPKEINNTTVQPIDVEVLFDQSNSNTGNTNGNNGSRKTDIKPVHTFEKRTKEDGTVVWEEVTYLGKERTVTSSIEVPPENK